MEQLFNDLEQRYVSLKNEHEHVCMERDTFKMKYSALQISHGEVSSVLENLKTEFAAKETAVKQRDAVLRGLESSQEELQGSLRRKQDEIERLRDDMQSQSAQIAALQEKLQASQISLAELEAQELPRQYSILKLERERASLLDRLTASEKEAEIKTVELQQIRSSWTNEVSELRMSLSTSQSEAKRMEERCQSLQESCDSLNEKYLSAIREIRDVKMFSEEQKSKLSSELDASKQQTDLYKRYFEENNATISELEEKMSQLKESHNSKISVLKDKLKQVVEVATAEKQAMKETFEKTIADLQAQLELQASTALQSGAGKTVAVVDREDDIQPSTTSLMEFQALGMTEMYAKVIDTEKALFAERRRSADLEYYLERVHAEVESKAPHIEAQRRDYRRVLDSHDKLMKRLDAAIAENVSLKKTMDDNNARCKEAIEQANGLEQQNKDLSEQIQHLLYKSFVKDHGHGVVELPSVHHSDQSASDVISEHLLKFDDVAELQLRNSQLVKVVRKLSVDQENAVARLNEIHQNGGVVPGSGGVSLENALKELNFLKDSRQRMEDMVASLVQQRDVLRAMLEEAEAANAGQKQGAVLAILPATNTNNEDPATSAGTPSRAQRVSVQSSPIARQLESRLNEVSEENLRLKERCNRLELAEKSIMEAYEKCKLDLNEARLQAAKAAAESQFQSDRCKDLESTRQILQKEVESVSSRCMELNGFIVNQQAEAAKRDALVAAAEERTRSALERLRRVEVEVEVLTAAEARAVSQLMESREEVKRQMSLTESISRIESSLSVRAKEEQEVAVRDRDSAIKAMEQLRKESADSALVADQKIRSLEDDNASLRRRLEDATAEVSSKREELARTNGVAQAAQDRASLLERQLVIAQEQLVAIRGSATIAGSVAEDNVARDMQLEQTLKENESLRAQIVAAELHTEQFRKIGLNTESMLKELREKSAAAKTALEEQLKSLQSEIDEYKVERAERMAAALKAEEEISNLQSKYREAERKQAEELSQAQDQLRTAQELAAQAAAQAETLRADAEACQQAARSAQSNYDRELQLHAIAASRARESEALVENLRVQIATLNAKITNLSTDLIIKEKAIDELDSTKARELTQLREEKNVLQRTNDLLHSQVQALGVQVDRLQATRLGAATEKDILTSESLVNEDQNTSLADMREVLRYMKREHDILEAKNGLLETENARQLGTITALQRSIDEVRAELRKALDSQSSGRSQEEFSRLMAEVTQLNIVRESNAHLRSENEELSRRNNALGVELKIAKESLSPLREQVRKMESLQASLTAERDAVAVDATYWKDRLHQLVSRYNDIDPESHRLLTLKVAEMESKLQQLTVESEALRAQNEKELAVSAKFKLDLEAAMNELESCKSFAASEGKNSENLRTRLREAKKLNIEMTAKVQLLTKQLADAANEKQNPIVSQALPPAAPLSIAPGLARAALPPAAVETGAAASESTDGTAASRKRPLNSILEKGSVDGAIEASPIEAPLTVASEQSLREALLKRKLDTKHGGPKPAEVSEESVAADDDAVRKKPRQENASEDAIAKIANPTAPISSDMEVCNAPTTHEANAATTESVVVHDQAETAAEVLDAAKEIFSSDPVTHGTPGADQDLVATSRSSVDAPKTVPAGAGKRGGRGAGRISGRTGRAGRSVGRGDMTTAAEERKEPPHSNPYQVAVNTINAPVQAVSEISEVLENPPPDSAEGLDTNDMVTEADAEEILEAGVVAGGTTRPPPLLERTSSSPFLNLKVPSSPMAGAQGAQSLVFGKPVFGKTGGVAPGESGVGYVFKVPSTAAATEPQKSGGFSTTTMPSGSLFSRALQSTASPAAPTPPSVFGASFGTSSSATSFALASSASSGPNIFAAFARAAENTREKEKPVVDQEIEDREVISEAAKSVSDVIVSEAPDNNEDVEQNEAGGSDAHENSTNDQELAQEPVLSSESATEITPVAEDSPKNSKGQSGIRTPGAPVTRPVVLSGGLTAQERIARRLQKFNKLPPNSTDDTNAGGEGDNAEG